MWHLDIYDSYSKKSFKILTNFVEKMPKKIDDNWLRIFWLTTIDDILPKMKRHVACRRSVSMKSTTNVVSCRRLLATKKNFNKIVVDFVAKVSLSSMFVVGCRWLSLHFQMSLVAIGQPSSHKKKLKTEKFRNRFWSMIVPSVLEHVLFRKKTLDKV